MYVYLDTNFYSGRSMTLVTLGTISRTDIPEHMLGHYGLGHSENKSFVYLLEDCDIHMLTTTQ